MKITSYNHHVRRLLSFREALVLKPRLPDSIEPSLLSNQLKPGFGLSGDVTRHRLGPTNKLDCPHAMGTNAFSPQRAESFRHFLLLPSPPFVYHRRQPTILRVSFRAGTAQFQTSRLRIRSHAGACSPPAQRTT